MKRVMRFVGIFFGCLFLLILIAIAVLLTFADVSASASSTLKSGRSITAVTHSWSGIGVSENSNDTATVDAGGFSVIVAPKKLIVDGRTFAAIDENTKSVVIDVHKGEIAFKADGELVGSLVR